MNAREDILVMKSQDLERYQIIRKVFDNQINQQEAAEYLDLSDRQIRRIVKRVRLDGARGVIHKLRGCSGCRRLEEPFKSKTLGLYRRYVERQPNDNDSRQGVVGLSRLQTHPCANVVVFK